MWMCPKCKESMHDYDDYCWSCKTRNPLRTTHSSPVADAPEFKPVPDIERVPAGTPMKKCPFCAEEIRLEAKKCRFCGSFMPKIAEQAGSGTSKQTPATQTRKNPIMKFMPAIIIIIAFIGLLAGIFGVIAVSKPIFKSFEPKIKAVMKTSAVGATERAVAYEEVTEYDARGKVVKTTRNYAPSKK